MELVFEGKWPPGSRPLWEVVGEGKVTLAQFRHFSSLVSWELKRQTAGGAHVWCAVMHRDGSWDGSSRLRIPACPSRAVSGPAHSCGGAAECYSCTHY